MISREKAEALMKTKEWILALVEWEKFHETASAEEKDPNSFHDMGICKFNCGRMKEAISDLDRAAELQPDYGYRFAARGWMKQSMGDRTGAIADYKKAIELDPSDIYTQNNLIILEEKRNKKSRN
ncbi:MAG: hypothetical protein CL823_03185 [Crocinitomicaceae bacterium]|nr:hypothetical protein [Crocinitomicaceae bacterium]|tara:strand:+ start:255 stop:629 length:375 start_codon:yes stop_codon:yes gene_type:complete